jgi:hypothetical protein
MLLVLVLLSYYHDSVGSAPTPGTLNTVCSVCWCYSSFKYSLHSVRKKCSLRTMLNVDNMLPSSSAATKNATLYLIYLLKQHSNNTECAYVSLSFWHVAYVVSGVLLDSVQEYKKIQRYQGVMFRVYMVHWTMLTDQSTTHTTATPSLLLASVHTHHNKQ